MEEGAKKKGNTAVIIVIVVLVALGIYYFSSVKKSQTGEISQEEKAAILEDINNTEGDVSLSGAERKKISADLNAASAKTPPLNEAEKEAIRNSYSY